MVVDATCGFPLPQRCGPRRWTQPPLDPQTVGVQTAGGKAIEALSTETAALGLLEGFEGYQVPSDAERNASLQSGLVALDTNALLNLYRYTEGTRDDLLRVLESLGDRLWLPHQVVREFWRNRLSALGNPQSAAKQVRDALQKSQETARRAIDAWAKQVALPADRHEAVLTELDDAVRSVLDAVEGGVPGRVEPTIGTSEDPIVSRLARCLDGKVGSPWSKDEWKVAVEEGKRRAEAQEPPGYLDAEKADSLLPQGPSGDYLVWAQLMAEGQRRRSDIVLVTGDQKADWWWTHYGARLGPRVELVQEYQARCGGRFFMFTPTDLLERSDALSVTVAEESVVDAARVRADLTETGEWTAAAVDELLRRLEAEGREQAEVIREAARNGGVVERQAVYEIGGYDEDRMLRGFTRPTARITQELEHEGILTGSVTPMLVPVYQGVQAAAFKIPYEVVKILAGGG